jgi:DNA-binding LacI/PurR family transcriptional regulator
MVRDKKDNISIKDIAKIAGVSITTVSHALSGKRYVKEDTKKKIFRIIKKYDYEPNIIARSLIKKESNLIGVITTELNNEFYSEIINGIENTVGPLGYILIINSSNYNADKELNIFKKLNSLMIDGLILIGGSIDLGYLNKFNIRSIPVILINRGSQDDSFTSIIVDYEKSMKSIVDHLAETGHKDIGYIGWQNKEEFITLLKFQGFLDGLQKNKLKRDNSHIFLKNKIMYDGFQEAYDIVNEYFDSNEGKRTSFDALVCQTDQIAVGAIKALKGLKFKIPKDISVAGFGDVSIGKFSDPPVTTVAIPKEEMGKVGANKFLKMHEEKIKKVEKIILDSSLIIRDSTQN